jgi:hypothetical protein
MRVECDVFVDEQAHFRWKSKERKAWARYADRVCYGGHWSEFHLGA